VLNFIEQYSHSYGFIFSCTASTCFLIELPLVKVAPQIEHW
jgi:hypothetical protein